MYKLFIIILSILILAGILSAQELKIGVVNSEIIMQAYPEFRRAEEQLAREVEVWRSDRSGWESEMEKMQKQIMESEKTFLAGQNSFSEKKKSNLSAKIDTLKFRYQERLNQQITAEQEKFNQRRAELLAAVLETVNKTIEEIGEELGFNLILDSSNGMVVYAKDPEDLTDILLRQLEDK